MTKVFEKKVDMRSRKSMTDFLRDHFRYDTMSSWNNNTSYAHNVKIYNLGLTREQEDKLWDMVDIGEAYDGVNALVDEFNRAHNYEWQAGFNGRCAGYLVLYQGQLKPTEYKSYCPCCGQMNYKTVEESGNNICGACKKATRINFKKPPTQVVTFGRGTDMDDDYEDWTMDELRDRVRLVKEFDKLATDIAKCAEYTADNFDVDEEEIYAPQTRRCLKEA